MAKKPKNKVDPLQTTNQQVSENVPGEMPEQEAAPEQENASQSVPISLPRGPHFSFIDVSGNSYQCLFQQGVHYLYDEAKVDEASLASHYIAAMVNDNSAKASHQSVNSANSILLADLKQIFEQAVNHALEHNNGCLYLDLVGVNQEGIDATDYACMLEEILLSLPTEKFEKLMIAFPVNGKKYSEHADVEAYLRKLLLMYRLRRFVYEKLKLDVKHEETLYQIDFLLSTILEPTWTERLKIFNQRLKGLETSLELTANQFQQGQFVQSCQEMDELIVELIKPACYIDDGKVLRFVDDFLQVLKMASIKTESHLFKKDNNSDDGFLENMKNPNRQGPVQINGVQLVSDDLQAAIYQLAVDNPEKADAILAIELATMGSIGEVIKKIATDNFFPRHIIVHSADGQCSKGGHWTRISLVTSKLADGTDKLCVTHVDPLGTEGAGFLKPIIAEAFPKTAFPDITKKVVRPCGTSDQYLDGWTCGYHALTGVLRGIVPENRNAQKYKAFSEEELYGLGLNTSQGGVPNSDLRQNGAQRRAALTHWLFQLIFGVSYAQHCQQNPVVHNSAKRNSPQKEKSKNGQPEVSSSSLSSKADQEESSVAKQENGSIANIDKLSQNVLRCNKKRQGQLKIDKKRKKLLSRLQTLDSQLEGRNKMALYNNSLFQNPNKLKEAKIEFKSIESYMASNPNIDPIERQALLSPLEDLLRELPEKLEAAKEYMNDASTDSAEEEVSTEEMEKQSSNPLNDAQNFKEDKLFKETLEKIEAVPLSEYEMMRYERIMRGVLNSAIDKSNGKGSGRLHQVKGGELKIKKIKTAILEIDRQILKELLDAFGCFDQQDCGAFSDKYELLKAKHDNIEENRSNNSSYLLSPQEQLIEHCFSRINYEGMALTLNKDDPARQRAVLKAFDDPASNFYQAVNYKRESFFGISCTFFSASSWYDIFNGDSLLLKDMKAADRTCDQSKPAVEVELVESTQVCQQV